MVSGVDSESSPARCEGAQARSASASSSDFPRDVVGLKSGLEGKMLAGRNASSTHTQPRSLWQCRGKPRREVRGLEASWRGVTAVIQAEAHPRLCCLGSWCSVCRRPEYSGSWEPEVSLGRDGSHALSQLRGRLEVNGLTALCPAETVFLGKEEGWVRGSGVGLPLQ